MPAAGTSDTSSPAGTTESPSQTSGVLPGTGGSVQLPGSAPLSQAGPASTPGSGSSTGSTPTGKAFTPLTASTTAAPASTPVVILVLEGTAVAAALWFAAGRPKTAAQGADDQ
jgi:hypothetical protein